jgi:hypothetical protein
MKPKPPPKPLTWPEVQAYWREWRRVRGEKP